MLRFISLEPAENGRHKYQITLQDLSSGKTHQIKFGAYGYEDYTMHKDDKRKSLYILRHRAREDWNDPLKPGTLSRYVLWNKPTLMASLKDYLKRFSISSNWG